MNGLEELQPLKGLNIVTIALNVPGPIAAAELAKLGAKVIKVEPPQGDQIYHLCKDWYDEMHQQQDVIQLNLKDKKDNEAFNELLKQADFLITAQRPKALQKLGLGWRSLHAEYPSLNQLAIVGEYGEKADEAGHDLTYQSKAGLLQPPHLPSTLVSDMAAAEKALSTILALCLAKSDEGHYAEVSLSQAAKDFAKPLSFGLTASNGVLGGALAEYALYETSNGWVAVAALEAHFKQRLIDALEMSDFSKENLAAILIKRTTEEWVVWAKSRDIPLDALPGNGA